MDHNIVLRYGASLGGPLCDTSKMYVTSTTGKSRVRNRTKSTNNMTNIITMVVKPLAPPAAWIWWTHAAWGVGGLAHVRSYADVEEI